MGSFRKAFTRYRHRKDRDDGFFHEHTEYRDDAKDQYQIIQQVVCKEVITKSEIPAQPNPLSSLSSLGSLSYPELQTWICDLAAAVFRFCAANQGVVRSILSSSAHSSPAFPLLLLVLAAVAVSFVASILASAAQTVACASLVIFLASVSANFTNAQASKIPRGSDTRHHDPKKAHRQSRRYIETYE